MSDAAADLEAKRIEELVRSARFSHFSDDEISRIVSVAHHLTVPEGWALMVEKTGADKAYLILKGEVSVRRQGEEVGRAGAGELIGEMALVNHKLRSATVVAETPLEVLHFTGDSVAELQKAIPHFADALSATAEERGGSES